MREISFCFTSFHLLGSIWWMNYACKLRDDCICTQTHMWILSPPAGIRQLLLTLWPTVSTWLLTLILSVCPAYSRWLWWGTKLMHTAACHLYLCHCIIVGPPCSWWGEWLAECTAHKHTSGLTQNQSHQHDHYTSDSVVALSPNPPASTTVTYFNCGAFSF